MSKQFRVSLDPLFLKPVIEAMIFASEEPLSGRALIRLLAGDRETESDDGAAVQDAEASGADVDASADETVAGDDAVAGEDAAEEDADAVSIDASIAHATSIDRGEEEGEEVATANADVSEADASGAEDGSEAEAMPQDGLTGSPRELAEAVERAEARKASKRAASTGLDVLTVRTLVAELNEEYEITGRAFRIVEVAGGYQFATTRDYGEFVALMAKEKLRRRLSPAALETLAIIAYRQPVSKPEVEAIRGVNCDQVLVNLMEKNLVVITGRSEGVGRPLLYGTTEDFLRSFGLKGIGDLPKLREIEELMEEGTYSAEKAEVITVDANTGAEEIEARVGAAGHTEHSEAEGSEAGQSAADGDADNQHGSIELVAEDGDAMPTAGTDGSEAAEIDDEPDDAEDAEEIDDLEDDGDDEEDEEEIEDEDDDDEGDDEDGGPDDEDGDEEIDDEGDDEIDPDGDEDLDDEPADDGGDEEAADRASGVGAADEPVMAEPGEADE